MPQQPSQFDPKTHAPTHAANVAQITATITGAWGNDVTCATALKTAINAILACLKEAGLMNID
jgi:hypothetical protein